MVSITYFYDYWFLNYKGICQESKTFIARIYHTDLTAIYGGYSLNFSSGRIQYQGLLWAGSGAEPQQLEAVRRRRNFFKDRLDYPSNSKHFKAQIFTHVKLLIHIILHNCTIKCTTTIHLVKYKNKIMGKFDIIVIIGKYP